MPESDPKKELEDLFEELGNSPKKQNSKNAQYPKAAELDPGNETTKKGPDESVKSDKSPIKENSKPVKKSESKKLHKDEEYKSFSSRDHIPSSSTDHSLHNSISKLSSISSSAKSAAGPILSLLLVTSLAGGLCYGVFKGCDYIAYKTKRGAISLFNPDKAKKLEELDSLVERYKQEIESNPSDIEKYLSLASAYIRLGHYSDALSQAKKVRKLDPKRYEPYSIDGTVAGYQRNWDKSESSFKQAIELNPGIKELHYALAGVYTKKRDFDKSISELNVSLSIDPNFANAYEALGKIYLEKDNKSLAKENFRKAANLGSEESKRYAENL